MDASEVYFHWRERVFEHPPTAHRIPPDVLTDYLNELRAAREIARGIDRRLLAKSILEIIAHGKAIYSLTKESQ